MLTVDIACYYNTVCPCDLKVLFSKMDLAESGSLDRSSLIKSKAGRFSEKTVCSPL
jgi:hypothetical protein